MVGTELLQAGQLSEALERVAGEVKAKPGDPAPRTFYFELLCLAGELDKAGKQLDIVADSGTWGIGADTYKGALLAENERRQFFHGGARPHVSGDPPYASAYLEAVEHYAAGNHQAAAGLLEQASERSLRGTLNGAAIQELTDSHDLLGPFLEVIMENHYAWVPWEAVQSLVVPEPRYLRDTIWAPASLTLHSGGQGEVLVFALYPDSHLQADDIKLGHRTIWETNPAGFTVAYGQKVIASGEHDCPILQMRTLEVEVCPLAA